MAYRESFYRFLMTQRNPGSVLLNLLIMLNTIVLFQNKKKTMKSYQTT